MSQQSYIFNSGKVIFTEDKNNFPSIESFLQVTYTIQRVQSSRCCPTCSGTCPTVVTSEPNVIKIRAHDFG